MKSIFEATYREVGDRFYKMWAHPDAGDKEVLVMNLEEGKERKYSMTLDYPLSKQEARKLLAALIEFTGEQVVPASKYAEAVREKMLTARDPEVGPIWNRTEADMGSDMEAKTQAAIYLQSLRK